MSRTLTARELAGDRRAGSWARQRAWRTQREFVRARWRLVVAMWLLLASPALIAWWFLPTLLQGVVLGAALMGATTIAWYWVVQVTGTGPVMMGDQAEQWTAQELRKMQRHGWRLVNHFGLSGGGDIDHVLVGPGGVIVVETKWSASAWDEPWMSSRLSKAQEHVRRNARLARLWKPVKDSGASVHGVVVLWGGSTERLTAVRGLADADNVPIIAGRSLVTWVEELPDHVSVEPARVDALAKALQRQVEGRDSHERAASPPVVTLEELVTRIAYAIAAASAGFFAVAEAATIGGSGVSAGLGLVLVVLSLWARIASKGWRSMATAWSALIVGASMPTGAILVALAVDAVT